MSQIISNGITCQKTSHQFRNSLRTAEYQEVDVIFHQSPSQYSRSSHLHQLTDPRDKILTGLIITEYRAPFNSPYHHKNGVRLAKFQFFRQAIPSIAESSGQVNRRTLSLRVISEATIQLKGAFEGKNRFGKAIGQAEVRIGITEKKREIGDKKKNLVDRSEHK